MRAELVEKNLCELCVLYGEDYQRGVPMIYLSRDQVRRIDALAINELGIPGVVLMENAGRSVAEETVKLAQEAGLLKERDGELQTQELNVAVVCGGGNNGGDGYVIARHLYNAGCDVVVYPASDPKKLGGDAAINFAIAQKMDLERREILDEEQLAEAERDLERANVIVDALLGTGFSGDVRPHIAAVIRRLNALALQEGRKMVAVDLPSGLDCDSGQHSNATIRADLTVTFVALKKGFKNPNSESYTGRVVVAGIGTPPELLERV